MAIGETTYKNTLLHSPGKRARINLAVTTFDITPDAFGPKWLRILRVTVEITTYWVWLLIFMVLWIPIRHYWIEPQSSNLTSVFKAYSLPFFFQATMCWFFLRFVHYWLGDRKRLKIALSENSLFVEGNSWYGARLLLKNEIGYVRENSVMGMQLLFRAAGLHVGDHTGKIDIFVPSNTPGYQQIRIQLLDWLASAQPQTANSA